MSENRVLRRIFVSKEKEVNWKREIYIIMSNLINSSANEIRAEKIKYDDMSVKCNMYVEIYRILV
jgi:hypothetical protein